ncbi:MAG TPA: TlpA disulfide reductase family protein [Candidatus Limnocylindria bacterium]|jgi:thiol-disulfide isomerase/thioredoxin|nr:TlpA disulfide reductase family protein [Candidatus Limnocylindria bacterium]
MQKYVKRGGLAIAVLFALTAFAASETKPGDKFPNLAKMELEGTIPDTKGKVLMVDFWASWCDPCKRAFPIVKELHEKYADKGLVILAVSLDENRKEMQRFLADHPVPFAVVRDARETLARAVRPPGMPTTIFVRPDGTIHSIVSEAVDSGFKEKLTKMVEDALKTLPPKQ